MNFKKQKELTGHSSGVYSLAYDSHFLYSASADHFVTRWLLTEGVQDKFAIKFDFPVYSICLLNNKQHIAVGLSSGDVHIFDLKLRQEIKYFTQHKKAVFSICENSILNHFYTTDADGNLSIWNATNFELLLYLPLDCGKIRRVSVAGDGKNIALACQDGSIRVFETSFYNEIISFKGHSDGATAVLFHPLNYELLISGGKDALLKVWNWKEGELLKGVPGHNYVIYDIISVDKGKTIITCSRDKTIKIWDSESFVFRQRLDGKVGGHRHSVNSIVELGDNSFASASDDKRIIIWEEDPKK